MSSNSKNRFSNYYKAGCSTCFSNTDPFETNSSYLSDLPFSGNTISGASEYSSRNYTIGGSHLIKLLRLTIKNRPSGNSSTISDEELDAVFGPGYEEMDAARRNTGDPRENVNESKKNL